MSMTKKRNVTLLDIAKELKVTKVTVSKALRGHPDISEKTSILVKETAEKMGYIPNLAAKNLSSRKTNTIGVIVPKVAHSFYPSLVDALYSYARLNNYEIVLTVSQEDTDLEKQHIITMLSMQVDGIIAAVTNNTTDKNIFNLIRDYNIPLIQIDRTITNQFTRIVFDDVEGTYNAVKYALENGAKKPAFVGGNHKLHVGHGRLEGYKKALDEAGVELDERMLLEGGFNEKVGYNALMEFNDNNCMPDFIFAVTYPIALGISSAAKELGLSIPEQLEIISFGDSFFNKHLSPPIKSIYQDTDKMARSAISEVIYAIENKQTYEPKNIIIKSDIRYK